MAEKPVWYSGVKKSADGFSIPVAADGRAFHSLYGARREAQAFVDRLPQEGFVVFAGLGAALHVKEFLNRWPDRRCLVAEADKEAVIQLRALTGDHGLAGFSGFCGIAAGPDELAVLLQQSWLPALDGPVTVAPLRPFTEIFPDSWRALLSVFNSTVERIGQDFSVQAFFGKLWHRNILANLFYLSAHENAMFPDWHGERVAVAAAGPGLQTLLDGNIGRSQDSSTGFQRLVAVDTALPVLLGHGIKVDAVISIDPQIHSQKHFLSGIPADCLPVFDLGSNPGLARTAFANGIKPLFTIGRHPLAAVAAQFYSFPVLQSGTGTVTIAAADFARQTGAAEIQFYGADFSCPRAVPYVPGTYLDAVFSAMQTRLEPITTAFTSLVFRDTVIRRIEGTHSVYYSPLLDRYRAGLEYWADEYGMILENIDGFRRARFKPVHDRPVSGHDSPNKSRLQANRLFPFDDFLAAAAAAWKQDALHAENRTNPWLYAILPFMAWCSRTDHTDVFQLAQARIARYTGVS